MVIVNFPDYALRQIRGGPTRRQTCPLAMGGYPNCLPHIPKDQKMANRTRKMLEFEVRTGWVNRTIVTE